MTQEGLAERCDLASDTIRRLEHDLFSPSLTTLNKLCDGLSLTTSTLFLSFELGEFDGAHELADLLSDRTPRELELVSRVLRVLFDGSHELADLLADRTARELDLASRVLRVLFDEPHTYKPHADEPHADEPRDEEP